MTTKDTKGGWTTLLIICLLCMYIPSCYTKPAPVKLTTVTRTSPAPPNPSSPLITKLNQLAKYIYNGFDILAAGQNGLNTTLKSDQERLVNALETLKIQLTELKLDQKASYEILKWEQKTAIDVIKWNIESAFNALKFEFEVLMKEQRGLKAEQKAGFDEMNGRMRRLESGQANQTSDSENVKGQLTNLQRGVADLKSVHVMEKVELNAINAQMVGLKASLERVISQSQSDRRDLENLIKKTTTSKCDKDWVEFEGRCHKFITIRKKKRRITANGARNECAKRGADLVHVRSESHHSFLWGKIPKYDLWIGGHGVNGAWTWPDGREVVPYRWASGEPTKTGCMYIYTKDQYWHSAPCHGKAKSYVCEKETKIEA